MANLSPGKPDLGVRFSGITFKNPIIAASGTFGYGIEYDDIVSLEKLGGLVTKGLSREAMAGNPPPRLFETAAGMLNSIGLQNIGARAFIEEKLPQLQRKKNVVVICNVFGFTREDYEATIRMLNQAEGIAAKASAGDLTQPEAARAATAAAQSHFGGLDIVVNVAGGFFSFGPFTEVKPEILDREIAVNFRTAFFMCQAAMPLLISRGSGGGAIVNFASIAVVRSLMHMSAYSAAKSAVAGLTRALAREYRDANVRVNAVAPATVRTADNVAQMGDKQPLVELDEVVNTVLFLASDEASAITGQIVPITGKAY